MNSISGLLRRTSTRAQRGKDEMAAIGVTFFMEIKNYEAKSIALVEKEFFDEMKNHNIKTRKFSVCQTIRFKNHKHVNFLISLYNRHVKYPIMARRQFKELPINHILHNINATMLFLAPRGCTTIVTCHDLHSTIPHDEMEYKLDRGGRLRRLFKIISNKAIKRADMVIAISHNTKRDLMRCLGIPLERIRVIYHGVNRQVFRPRDKYLSRDKLNIPRDIDMILSVSSDEPRKNTKTLIEAVSYISKQRPNLRLFHVGDLSRESSDAINILDLKNRITCLRNIGERELAYLYNAADLLVFPSFYEGFGLPPLEAMASGCPVITSNRSSLPEVVGDAGIMIDPRDSGELAQKIGEVIDDENLRAEMIKKGLEQAEKFTWEKCVEQTIAVYRKFMNGGVSR